MVKEKLCVLKKFYFDY